MKQSFMIDWKNNYKNIMHNILETYIKEQNLTIQKKVKI